MDDFRIVTGDMVSLNHVKQALELDKKNYNECYHLQLDTCYGYYNKNSQIYIMCENSVGKVVGYINFSPITDKFYEGLRDGKYIDTDLTCEDLLSYDKKNKVYKGYLSSIIVDEDYRGKGIAKKLLVTFIEQLIELSSKGIYFSRLILDAVSNYGQIVARKIGFHKVCTTDHGSTIYEAKLIPLQWIRTEYNAKANDVYRQLKI